MINRDLILAVIPHTHRNRFLPTEEQQLLQRLRDREEHRQAERKIKP